MPENQLGNLWAHARKSRINLAAIKLETILLATINSKTVRKQESIWKLSIGNFILTTLEKLFFKMKGCTSVSGTRSWWCESLLARWLPQSVVSYYSRRGNVNASITQSWFLQRKITQPNINMTCRGKDIDNQFIQFAEVGCKQNL